METDLGEEMIRKSNHRVAYIRSDVPRKETFETLMYIYRYYNAQSELEYGRWLAGKDWSRVLLAEGSNCKTDIYQQEVSDALERFFHW